jgi:chromosome segregation ATPase
LLVKIEAENIYIRICCFQTVINMTDERQLVTFEAGEQAKIVKALKGLQSGGALTAFKNLSETIKIVIGMLPKKFIPILQKLSTSYSTTTKTIKVGFADLCAILSKFVIKSWRIIQRGMNKEDKNALITLRNELNTDFKNELAKFVDLSRSDLVNIYSQLLFETPGDKITQLLRRKDALEKRLLRLSENLTNISSEYGANEGKIVSIEYQRKIYGLAIRDSKTAKLDLKAEILELRRQKPYYKNQVQQHRDTRTEERGRFWIFSWKVRDVYIDNGERIARENLNRLLDRIHDLEERLKNWSSDYLTEQMTEATANLPTYKAKRSHLEREHRRLEKWYNGTKKNFSAVIQRMDTIYQSTGTVDIKSIKAVDELCHALQTGSEALISACDKLRTHLATIDLDPNSLVDAVIDALQLINMADEYNDSTKIKDIKLVLALE